VIVVVRTLYSRSPDETRELGRRLGALLGPGDLVVLNGGLGAGKTLFAGGVGQGLGVKGPLPSPTFILIREYHDGRLPLYHMDAYRLDEGDLADLGVEEYFYGDGVTLVEWGERVASLLPEERLEIRFSPVGDGGRTLALTARGGRYRELIGEWLRVVGSGH